MRMSENFWNDLWTVTRQEWNKHTRRMEWRNDDKQQFTLDAVEKLVATHDPKELNKFRELIRISEDDPFSLRALRPQPSNANPPNNTSSRSASSAGP